ncbi:MAG TPA: chemotaxis protein CheW [Aggregatilineales bacterium]|nr:chemotaxis protein CheW [Aggregatilineales bacterium]
MNFKTGHYLSVRVLSQWYGIPIETVVEVHHLLLLTELPVSVPNVVGLMSLRDRVFPVFDLRLCFGLPNPPYNLNTPLVALQTPTGLAAIIVDEADTVENVSSEQLVNIEGNYPYVNGAAQLSNRLLLLLDTALFAAEIGT